MKNYTDESRCYPPKQAASKSRIILILILSYGKFTKPTFPITDTLPHFCFTFVFLSNDFFLSPNGMNQNQKRKYSRIHFHRLMYSKIKIAM